MTDIERQVTDQLGWDAPIPGNPKGEAMARLDALLDQAIAWLPHEDNDERDFQKRFESAVAELRKHMRWRSANCRVPTINPSWADARSDMPYSGETL